MPIKDLKDEIEGLKRDLNLSTDALAGALKVDSRTVERWRTGASYPQREGRERQAARMNVRNQVLETFATAEVAHAGRIDRIEAALAVLDSGMFV
jgi:hypothetical protein